MYFNVILRLIFQNRFTNCGQRNVLANLVIQFVTGSAKTDIIVHFSNSILLHFYNLHTQMYVLAKFQLYILKAFEVTALQSSSNRKIDLYSKHRENKLQALTKTDVTYEWSDVQTQKFAPSCLP